MFVNVRVMTQVQDNGLTVPLDAVQQSHKGNTSSGCPRDCTQCSQSAARPLIDHYGALALIPKQGYWA
jgi:hypothetical protein